MNLLSSPLLKQLAYNVYYQGHRSEGAARSEWQVLTQALVAGGNVRVLKIEVRADETVRQYGGSGQSGSVLEKPMRFDISAGMRLPALEELTVQSVYGVMPYYWDTAHCQLFCAAVDVSQLRKLDFGSDKPDAFFSYFTGKLPGLKALRFGLGRDGSFSIATRFVQSLSSLESLDIDRAQSVIEELWPTIMERKATLKELLLRPAIAGYCEPQYIAIDRLRILASQFPMLERLGWDVPCKDSNESPSRPKKKSRQKWLKFNRETLYFLNRSARKVATEVLSYPVQDHCVSSRRADSNMKLTPEHRLRPSTLRFCAA